jgi:hypothetical protein
MCTETWKVCEAKLVSFSYTVEKMTCLFSQLKLGAVYGHSMHAVSPLKKNFAHAPPPSC